MATDQEHTEWAVFTPSFWDANQLVARSSDGCWIYPGTGFNPKQDQQYSLRLEKKISQKTQRPYYVGYPRHGSNTAPPQQFEQLLTQIQSLQHEMDRVKDENANLRRSVTALGDENDALQDEVVALRLRFAMEERTKPRGNLPVELNQGTIEKMLKNCSIHDLLGSHSLEKQKRVYRQLMLLSHPDKTRDFGEKTILILEELVKAIHAKYRLR